MIEMYESYGREMMKNRRKCHTNNLWKTHHNLTNPKQLQLKHKTN